MMRIVVLAGIKFYQKFLSPLKGFNCAHTAKHGGISCSAAVANIVKENPANKWWSLSRARLKSCGVAFDQLVEERDKKRRRDKNNGSCSDLGGCCPHHCDDMLHGLGKCKPNKACDDIGDCNIGSCDL